MEHTLWVSTTIKVQVNQETPYLTLPKSKGGKTKEDIDIDIEQQLYEIKGVKILHTIVWAESLQRW